MSGRRFNADTPLDPETKRKVEKLKRDDPEALEHKFARGNFATIRRLRAADHRPAQRPNATQMSNKAFAMKFLGWP